VRRGASEARGEEATRRGGHGGMGWAIDCGICICISDETGTAHCAHWDWALGTVLWTGRVNVKPCSSWGLRVCRPSSSCLRCALRVLIRTTLPSCCLLCLLDAINASFHQLPTCRRVDAGMAQPKVAQGTLAVWDMKIFEFWNKSVSLCVTCC
jgi:hypothetical protein